MILRLKKFILILLVCPSISHAFGTGNELYSACTDEDEFFELACLTYIAGTIQGFRFNESYIQGGGEGVKHVFCLPPKYTNNQGKDVVTKYLNEHPEQRHILAVGLIVTAMLVAFPCDE